MTIDLNAKETIRKIGFIYTLKYANWLNMAEIEINILDRRYTGERIECKGKLATDVMICFKKRNKR